MENKLRALGADDRAGAVGARAGDLHRDHARTSQGPHPRRALPLFAARRHRARRELRRRSRKLIIGTSRPDLRIVLVRASDVPTYVQYGGADLGVVGLDT